MAKRLRSDAVLGMGPEPIWVGEFNKTKLIDALNWYNYCYDQKKAKELIVSYCRHAKYDKKTIQHVKSIPDSRLFYKLLGYQECSFLEWFPTKIRKSFLMMGWRRC